MKKSPVKILVSVLIWVAITVCLPITGYNLALWVDTGEANHVLAFYVILILLTTLILLPTV